MRIQVTIPGEPNAETLGIALEAATRLAQHDIASGEIPPIEDAIKSGIAWQEEPPGQESFDKPSTVLERGWGDCDDLAPWLAAEMRETDFDPGASAIAIPSGPNTWHAIVKGSDGEHYDPSVWAGMPYSVSGFGAVGGACACCKPLNAGKPAVVLGARGVRVDMPGLRASRGCMIGVSHQLDCAPNDEARVMSLLSAIEDAIATAQLASTGDKRAIKQLAVIYRVLRGDDLQNACNGLHIRPDQVGIDFDSSVVRTWIRKAREVLANAADEMFAGETWMADGGHIVKARKVAVSGHSERAHRMGFVPCLAAIAPLASLAVTAGTIAAIVGPLALALEKMVGEDTDFGRAMKAVMDVTDKVKLVSAVGAGLDGLIENGIPAAFQQGSSRWVELLQSPLAAAGQSPQSVQQVADTMHWVERNAATVLPADLATRLTPQVLDMISTAQKAYDWGKDGPKKAADLLKKAFDTVKDAERKFLETVKNDPNALPPGIDLDKLAEAKVAHFFNALATAAPPPTMVPIPQGAYTPSPGDAPQNFPPAPAGPAPALATPGQLAAIDFVAAHVSNVLEKENLHPPPPATLHVPQGWDNVFALGCLQQTDLCK